MAASWQDRDGAKTTLLSTTWPPRIRHVFADEGFAGRLVDWAATRLQTTVEIVRKPPEQRGSVVHPKRWVVGRSLAWLTAHRRLAREYELDPAVSEAFIRWAAINTHDPSPRPRPTRHPAETPPHQRARVTALSTLTRGLPTWGDGRLVILGTEGYIELRKYVDVAGRPGGDHLYVVDGAGTVYIDCSDVQLSYYPDVVRDVINSTEAACPQRHTFEVMRLAIRAQQSATMLGYAQ